MRPIQVLHRVEGHAQVLGDHRQRAAGGLRPVLDVVSAVAQKYVLLREVRVGVIDFRLLVLRMVAALQHRGRILVCNCTLGSCF